MARAKAEKVNGKRLATQQSVNGAVKAIRDVMRRSNCAGALQYVPELTWILFLCILDEREAHETEAAEALGVEFAPSLEEPFRWRDRAAPAGAKRRELQDGTMGAHFDFVSGERCIVSLPGGVFTAAGAGVKTNLLFFAKGGPTERIWYYDLSPIKVGKKKPLTLAHFDEFFRLLSERADSEQSWSVTRQEIEAKGFDLKAVNPHAKRHEDTRTPEELLVIEAKGREIAEGLAILRSMTP